MLRRGISQIHVQLASYQRGETPPDLDEDWVVRANYALDAKKRQLKVVRAAMSAAHGSKTRRLDSMKRLKAFLNAAKVLLPPEQVEAIWARAVQDHPELNWPLLDSNTALDAGEDA